jgi:tetratricopeptide (TPR) repeat protein
MRLPLALTQDVALHRRALGCLARDEAAAAEDYFLQALRLRPDSAALHHDLANALFAQHRLEEAVHHLELAVALAPDLASAHRNLGNVLLQANRPARAAKHYRRALTLDPDSVETLYLLGLAEPLRPSACHRLEKIAARPGLATRDAVWAAFALGRALASKDRPDEAFSWFTQGNRLRRQTFDFDIAAEEDRLHRLIDSFPAELFSALPETGTARPQPIFLCGLPRTGKTLIEQLLAGSGVAAGGEQRWVHRRVGPAQLGETAAWPAGRLRALREDCLAEMRRLTPGAGWITNTLPGNFVYAGLLRRLFPEATLLHCVRHPLDTCLQCFLTCFAVGHRYSFDLLEMGRYYLAGRRLVEHWQAVLPGGFLEVRYEDLVAAPGETARQIAAGCGVPPPTSLPSLHGGEVGAWRVWERPLEPLRELLAKEVAAYEAQPIESSAITGA